MCCAIAEAIAITVVGNIPNSTIRTVSTASGIIIYLFGSKLSLTSSSLLAKNAFAVTVTR